MQNNINLCSLSSDLVKNFNKKIVAREIEEEKTLVQECAQALIGAVFAGAATFLLIGLFYVLL